MVFQQRNGRIDRYGQKFNPEIVYLLTDSATGKIKGDMRILELLIQKTTRLLRILATPLLSWASLTLIAGTDNDKCYRERTECRAIREINGGISF